MEKMEESYEKILNIIKQFFSQENITEIKLFLGNEVYFKYLGELKKQKLNFDISHDDIFKFEAFLLKKKNKNLESDVFYSLVKNIQDKLRIGSYVTSMSLDDFHVRLTWTLSQGIDYLTVRRVLKTLPSTKEIGIPKEIKDILVNYKKGGLVIFSSPMDNGKTTTISSMCQEFFNENCLNVITLEDPIEYFYDKNSLACIEQRERGVDFRDYSDGITAALTLSADIIILQEIKEIQTLKDALYLAEKSVLVLSTMHTRDSTDVFTSIIDKYPDSEKKDIRNKMSSYLSAVISQRLVPLSDGTGRIPIFEALFNTPEVKGYLKSGNEANLGQLIDHLPNIDFAESFFQKVKSGIITKETALDFCPESRLYYLQEKLDTI